MDERRKSPRKALSFYFNKYIAGHPYLCRALDISLEGIQAVTLSEPETRFESFPVEIRLPGEPETLWLWAKRVRRSGKREVLELETTRSQDHHRLRRYLEVCPA
jgi:hypothetical protein